MSENTTPSWYMDFMASMEQGRADSSSIEYLDEFLSWHTSVNTKVPKEGVEQAIEKFGANGLRRRFEEYIDQLVIANPNNYKQLFPSDSPRDVAKSRYRQLISVFHPDRGERDDVWLSYRIRRINEAYEYYMQGAVDTSAAPKDAVRFEPGKEEGVVKRNSGSTGRKISMAFARPNWRKWLGDPREFQRRIFLGVSCVAAILIILLLLSSAGA